MIPKILMPKRQRVIIRGKSRYIKRNKLGQITDNENINKAIKADMRKKAVKIVKSGYGWRGDLKRKKKV